MPGFDLLNGEPGTSLFENAIFGKTKDTDLPTDLELPLNEYEADLTRYNAFAHENAIAGVKAIRLRDKLIPPTGDLFAPPSAPALPPPAPVVTVAATVQTSVPPAPSAPAPAVAPVPAPTPVPPVTHYPAPVGRRIRSRGI